MNRPLGKLLAALVLLVSAPAMGQELLRDISSEYAKVIAHGSDVGALGDDMFGEQTNLYTGGTEFKATDVDIPGAIPVRFERRFRVAERDKNQVEAGELGNWEIDVPYMSGTFSRELGWQSYSAGNSRCGSTDSPKSPSTEFSAGDFWHGYHMYVPETGDQELLRPIAGASPTGPTTGGPYRWLTKDLWFISCTPTLANAGGDFAGEGFVAVSPDGTRYTFNYMVKFDVSAVTKPPLPGCFQTRATTGGSSGGDFLYTTVTLPGETTPTDVYSNGGLVIGVGLTNVACPALIMRRSEVRLYATRVQDRFGNVVNYNYSNGKLSGISSSDGRGIAINYGADGRVATVVAEQRIWSYAYAASHLVKVTLPDNSTWLYADHDENNVAGVDLLIEHDTELFTEINNNCLWPGYYGRELYYTVTHPSGAVGEFHLAVNRIPRTYMPEACLITTGTAGYFRYPPYMDVYSIFSKKIRGPGVPERTWSFEYEGNGGNIFTFAEKCANRVNGCKAYNVLHVTEPNGVRTDYTHGNKWNDTEGKLQKVEKYSSTGTLLSTSSYGYVTSEEAAVQTSFPDRVGDSPQAHGEEFDAERNRPQKKSELVLGTVSYSRETTAFDPYALPLTDVAGNSNGYSRIESRTYAHDTALWVIGHPATTSVNGSEVSRLVYDARMQPKEIYSFNALQQRMTYQQDGSLATVTDALGNMYSLTDYFRGLPRKITFPDTTKITATVSSMGEVDSRTDQLGSTWAYTYDALGRATSVTQPPEPSVAWNGTTFSFAPVATPEYGLPAGHWRRIEQTGSGRTTVYYDAQWRPVVTLTEDITDTASRSYVVRRYGLQGKEVFTSYPVATLSSYSQPLAGTRTYYDGLGRVYQVEQDSELGVLSTTNEYFADGRVRVTDPNGHATTTTFQQFDSPATNAPSLRAQPEGVVTSIVRDVFGKPMSITRIGPFAGANLAATRRYVYDANQRLCKVVNPESGADLTEYDAGGNLLWNTTGTNLTSTACDREKVSESAKVYRTYDALGRLKTVSTPNTVGNQTYDYELDGQIKSVVNTNPASATVTTSYGYNKRRLLTSETTSQPNWYAWTVSYGYNGNGHVNSLQYPNGLVFGYALDGLGRPSQVGTYAKDIKYFPNGAIQSFTYGNGVVHTMTQNVRGLPARSQDTKGTLALLDDTYTYDPAANVLDITDSHGAQPIIRAMSYDGLDRLTNVIADNLSTTAPNDALWGIASFTYDPLDNLRTASLGIATNTYNYDSNNRLLSLARSGGTSISYATDARGNITSNGSQAYTFNWFNQMTGVTGKESYRYDGLGRRALSARTGNNALFIYSQDGRELYTHDTRRGTRVLNIYLDNTVIADATQALSGGVLTARYVHNDALGTPVAKSDAAGSEIASERTTYTPYGVPNEHAVEGIGYAGHVMDWDTGLTYMQQRFYDPSIGRFLSVDPLRTDSGNGSAFNRYSYAANNPYRFVDPDGRREHDIFDGEPGSDYADLAETVTLSRWTYVYENTKDKNQKISLGSQLATWHGAKLGNPWQAEQYRLEVDSHKGAPWGILYSYRNPKTGQELVRQADSPADYHEAQNRSSRENWDVAFEFTVLGRYEPGADLKTAAEDEVRNRAQKANQKSMVDYLNSRKK